MAAVWPAGPLPMMHNFVLRDSLAAIAAVVNKRRSLNGTVVIGRQV
jgi:hypothetical protein